MAREREKSVPEPAEIRKFQEEVYLHYRTKGRVFPWRLTDNPYHILVSEMMLQQTQVERVSAKYERFIALFPDFPALASAALSDILKIWQGLGYNRRVLALKDIAQRVITDFSGMLPSSVEELANLPGIGRTTAGAICAFAFNRPAVFIETNIRAVYMDCFFRERATVHDADILPLVDVTLDKANPRVWYYALMDYGAMLKKTGQVPNSKSSGYRKQSPFRGSDRQIRGLILRALVANAAMSEEEILLKTGAQVERLRSNLRRLVLEGFIGERGGCYSLV